MKTVTFTDFRKKASGLITEVEKGETVVILRHGKPVAEINPVSQPNSNLPSWKDTFLPLEIKGKDLSSAILDDRNSQK
jgi:prevent-host-death family protein